MMWVPNVTFLLLTLSTICYGDNPGAKIQITEHGLEKGVEYLVNKMVSNNKVYPLPDVAGKENVASEDMSYEFTQIRVEQLHQGNMLSRWIPETGMHVSMENGSATINCNWKLDSSLIKDSGSTMLTLTGLSISIVMGACRIDPGVPSVYLLDCQSSVRDVDVQMSGGVSYVADTIKEPIQNVVRQTVSQQLCSSIRNQVKKWNQTLSHLNLNLSLNHLIELDLALMGNPEISEQYASIGLKGLFRLHNESHNETAFSPAPITLPVQDGAMIYIGVSQSSFDSLCYAYYTAGFLTFQVSHMVGSKKLTTSELAAYMPEITKHFPNPEPVKIQLHATRSPLMFLLPNNMTVQFCGSLQTYVYPSKAKPKNIFSVNIVASFRANLSFSEAKGAHGLNLTGLIFLDRLQIEGNEPGVNELKGVVTEKGVQQLCHEVVMPAVNEGLSKGIHVPTNFLKNANVTTEKGFAVLAADMQ